MTSAIGDVVNNPAIDRSNNDQNQSQVSLLSRLLNSFNKGAVWLPDAITNTLPKSAATLGDLLADPFLSQENQNPFKKTLLKANVPQDIGENFLRDIGAIRDLPEARTGGEKLAESFGSTLGSMALPVGVGALGGKAGSVGQALGKTLLGTEGPLTSLSQLANPTFAGTVGGAATQAAVAPSIHDAYKDHPYTEAALNMLAGILGGGSSSLAAYRALPAAERALPFATAAQRGNINDPRTKELIAKQLDITKKDPKAADILQNISQGQESRILSNLTPETTMSGQNIVKTIEDSISNLKSQRSTEYQNTLKNLIKDYQTNAAAQGAEGIDITTTLNKIDTLIDQTAVGSPLRNALAKSRSLVIENNGDPLKLISAKSAIQDMTQPTNELSLGTKQSSILKQVAHQLNQDLETALPGYSKMNSNYASQTQQLNDLLDGVVGRTANKGENNPSDVVRQLFEKTDPELVSQLKQVLPPDVYGEASNMYLNDVANRGLQAPTKNTFNKVSQYQKMGDILQRNRNVLSETLPPGQNATIDQSIQDINQTALGRPRNDYTIGSRRGLAVGDEIKGLGAIRDVLSYVPRKAGMDYLNRQEMLTGVSPLDQVTQGIGTQVPGVIQKGITANAISDDLANPQAPSQSPVNQAQPPQKAPSMPMMSPAQIGPGPISDVLSKYGVQMQGNGPQMAPGSATPSAPQAPTTNAQAPQAASPIDAVMSKYGFSGNGAPANSAAPQMPAPKGRIYTPEELDYMTKQLQGGDINSVLDFDNGYKGAKQKALQDKIRQTESSNNYNAINTKGNVGAYQMGAQALEDVGYLKPGASKMGNQALNDPNNWNIEGGLNSFLSNKQLQDQAMLQLLEDNKARLIKAGYIDENTPQNKVNGYLAVMHLAGMGGVEKLMKGKVARDPYGTSTSDYYNLGVGA